MSNFAGFHTVAICNIMRGFSVHPLVPGGKNPLLKGWPERVTKDRAIVAAWATRWPDANCAVAADVDTCILESDNRPELESRLGYQIPECFTVQARVNRPHFYFGQTDATRALGNRDLPGILEFKQSRKYVVAAGSVSPHGPIYSLLMDRPRYPMPDKLVADITALLPVVVKSEPSGAAHPAAVEKFVRRFRAFCDRLNVETSVQPLADGRVFIATSPCLTADLHSEGGEAGGVGVMPNGATFLACFHTHCKALSWADWRRVVEEKYKQPMNLDGGIQWK
jgi:hypothetical protein